MINENRPSRWLILLLWGLATVPSLVAILTEMNKTHLIWYIRVVDFADLVFVAPFYLAAFLSLQALIVPRERPFAFWLGLALIGVFMYGHAMHLTANAVNTYSTEIHDYKSLIPPDTYSLLYFLDEDLGHWILFTAYYGLLGIWLWEDRFAGVPQLQTALPGALLGVALAIAIIESSHPWFGIAASILLLGLAFLRPWREHDTFLKLWTARPVGRFVIASAVTTIVAELLYRLIVGSWEPPTGMGL